jgi:hypothetical protein
MQVSSSPIYEGPGVALLIINRVCLSIDPISNLTSFIIVFQFSRVYVGCVADVIRIVVDKR